MTIDSPSREEIINRERADKKALIPSLDPYSPTSVANADCVAHGNRIKEIHDNIDIVVRDSFAATAQGQALLDEGADYGLSLTPATQSEGNIIVTGIATTDVLIQSLFQASNGQSYQTTLTKTISDIDTTIDQLTSTGVTATASFNDPHGLGTGLEITVSGATEIEYNGTFTITVTSATTFQYTLSSSTTSPATGAPIASFTGAIIPVRSVNTGQVTNLIGGSQLTLQSTIPGVDNTAYTQFDGIDGGANEESEDDFRERLLIKKQQPETPFNSINIRLEARKVSGVTRVFVVEPNDVNTQQGVTSITGEGSGFQVVVFPAEHDLLSGMDVTISGADQAPLNGTFEVIYIDDFTIAYFVSGETGLATGSITTEYSNVQPGQTRVLFTRDGDLTIIPSAQEVQDVKDQILTIKPANTSDSDVIVEAPILNSIDFDFTTLVPDTTGIRTSIEQNLQDLFFQASPGSTITEDAYRTAIQNSFDVETQQGVQSFTLSTPTASITNDYNEIPDIGNITYSV